MRYLWFLMLVQLYSGILIAQGTSVEQAKLVKIGITQAPPLINLSSDSQPSGMLIDFLNAVAKEEKWTIQWVSGSWPEIYEKAKSSEIDILTYIAYSLERTQYFDFSHESFITGWGQVYAMINSNLINIFDFDNKDVALVRNDIHGLGFIDLCNQFKVNCQIKYVDNYDIAFSLLEQNIVDGVVSGSTVGLTYEKKFDIERTSIMYRPTDSLFASAKHLNNDYLVIIDKYLSRWKKDAQSPYALSKIKWLGSHAVTKIPIWLYGLVIFIVLMLIIAAILVSFLRKKVKLQFEKQINQTRQLNQIIDLVPHMIYVVNEQGKVVLVNKYASKHFGIPDSVNTTTHQILEKVPNYYDLFEGDKELLKNNLGVINTEITTCNHANENITFNISKVRFETLNKSPSILTVGVDVTEERFYQNRIKNIAEHDELTGLPNRLLLKQSIESALKQASNDELIGAILFIDLDSFKNVNDSLGHSAGDELLKIVCYRLTELTKDSDMVARIGGDEFIIQLKNISTDMLDVVNKIQLVTESVLKAISKKITIEQSDFYMSASIGVVLYPTDADSFKLLMKRADIAMYQAKFNGKNCSVVFKPKMESVILEKHEMIADLYKALEKSEFILDYQPQIDGLNSQLVGLEALVRWKNSNGQIIQPNEFISIAEESGLIIPIGFWVIEAVCKQLKLWISQFPTLPFITINVSVLQIQDSNFVTNLSQKIKQYEIPAHLIELEVTESIMIAQVDETVKTLSELKKLGVKLSIDDFGTGYSSLSYLKKLPLDKLKIDYSFVKDITEDLETQTIVKTIIAMTKELDLEVIAEGVEHKEQVELLMKIGCNYFQGFYYDRPNTAHYIEKNYLSDTEK